MFDTHRLLAASGLDRDRLRLGFVVYGAMNRKDWRKLSIDDVAYDTREVENELLPLLRLDDVPGPKAVRAWAERLVADCRAGLSAVLPLEKHEREFLDRLLDHGEVISELITQDPRSA